MLSISKTGTGCPPSKHNPRNPYCELVVSPWPWTGLVPWAEVGFQLSSWSSFSFGSLELLQSRGPLLPTEPRATWPLSFSPLEAGVKDPGTEEVQNPSKIVVFLVVICQTTKDPPISLVLTAFKKPFGPFSRSL